MKPTFAKHVIRSLRRELGDETTTAFPSIVNNKRFAEEYLLHNVARKFEPDEGTYDQTPAIKASIRKWVDSEWTCRVVNQHGSYYSLIYKCDRDLFSTLQQRTRFHIARILSGSYVDFADLSFSAGATSSARRARSSPEMKWSGMPDEKSPLLHNLACSTSCVNLVTDFLDDNPALASILGRRKDKIVDHSIETNYTTSELAIWLSEEYSGVVLDFVPKDEESVRIIAKSGSLQTSIQRQVGLCIAACLFAEGIDLKDQTVNQEWAEIGSLTGLIATVDLSSASDNIALHSLTYFPEYYRDIIEGARDAYVTTKSGQRHKLEKVAGMGNGFIFEYETVLFYAMALAVCDTTLSDASLVTVYGDDIIIPSGATSLLERFFLYNGFTFNRNKSFDCLNGFRESCGKHYYKGADITPFFIRGEIHELGDKFHVFNGLQEWSNRTGIPLTKTLALILSSIPVKDRHLVPISWSSRSGLHYEVPDCKLPVESWSKRYQRKIITYRAVRPRRISEIGKMPSIVLMRGSLLSLQRPIAITWERMVDIPIKKETLFLLRGYQPLLEYTVPTYGSEYEERMNKVTE